MVPTDWQVDDRGHVEGLVQGFSVAWAVLDVLARETCTDIRGLRMNAMDRIDGRMGIDNRNRSYHLDDPY